MLLENSDSIRRFPQKAKNIPTFAEEDRSCHDQITMFLTGKNPSETLNLKVTEKRSLLISNLLTCQSDPETLYSVESTEPSHLLSL